MRNAATQVTEVVIPHAGHWLMEEQPAATMAAIRSFLDPKALNGTEATAPRRRTGHSLWWELTDRDRKFPMEYLQLAAEFR